MNDRSNEVSWSYNEKILLSQYGKKKKNAANAVCVVMHYYYAIGLD